MFKKIHSNRDPRDTLYSEIKKEFSVYFDKGAKRAKQLVRHYPKFIFGLMITLLLTSIVLSVVWHKKTVSAEKVKSVSIPIAKPVNDGFDQILKTGAALRETIRLKKEVDSITAKKTLGKSDSALLLKDLDSLQHIRITINH